MSIIQGTSKSSAAAAYSIDQSIRFNDNDTPYLTWTPGADASSQTTFTISMWFKRGDLANNGALIAGYGGSGATLDEIRFNSGDGKIYFRKANVNVLVTTQVLRDPSSWYHLVLAVDTNDATSGDRYKLYLNGSRVTAFDTATYPSSGATFTGFTKNVAQYVGQAGAATGSFDGYLAEVIMVDGQSLDPTSFGETDSTTGQWVPIAYTGSYGTNGFYITGANSADLGADDSGNSNDFTSSGLAAADQVTDTPTDNHCTFNPLWIDTYTLSDGNLVTSTGADASALGTMAVDATDSDGWYWEMKVTTAATYPGVGIILASQTSLVANTALSGTSTNRYYYQGWSGDFNNQGSTGAYGGTWSGTANKVIGVYLKGGALWFSIDGVVQNSGDPSTASTGAAITGLTGDFYPVVVYPAGSGTQAAWTAQFAEADWGTTPPAGYKALSTANLPDPTIADPSAYFQTTLYTGNGTAIGSGGNAVDQSGNSTFQPDFVWIKNRDAADNHMLYDAVRGATKDLHSNTTDAEATDTEGLSTFDTDGFTVGSNVAVNTNTENYVAWQWAADGTSGSSNTDGATSSTVSASTTSGFSIVKWTGTASATTLGHGLGSVPKMIWVKNLADADSWVVYHEAMGATKGLTLDTASAPTTSSTFFNNTAPTSSVFTVGTGGRTNGSGDGMIAYCFAEVENYSKINQWTGNGSSDGSFVYTGFKPAFVFWKQYTNLGTNSWCIQDSARDPFNVVESVLKPDKADAEITASTSHSDFLSNGFKLRATDGIINKASSNYLYYAVAETPFKTATAR